VEDTGGGVWGGEGEGEVEKIEKSYANLFIF
jgi:hypothetical protein